MRFVRVAVFHDQAQAMISKAQSTCSIASCCLGFGFVYQNYPSPSRGSLLQRESKIFSVKNTEISAFEKLSFQEKKSIISKIIH